MATILQILPNLNSGGVERGTIEISNAILEQGYNSIVVSQGGVLVEQLEKIGAIHINMLVGSKNPWLIYKNALKLKKIINKYKVNIVHARSRAPAWSAYFACQNTKAKFVTTFHGVYSGKARIKKFYNSVMLKSKKIITVSNFISKHIQENYNFTDLKKLCLIHRGVDINAFRNKQLALTNSQKYIKKWQIPANKKIILMPGRITEWKGQEFLIKALNKLDRDDYYCLMVGDVSKHPNFLVRLESLIKTYNLEKKISIRSNVLDIENLYNIAYMVVSASIRPEAFGRVVVEAGAMGKIVVATNHGGATETVIDKKTGFLVKHDDVNDLARAIDQALDLSITQKKNMEKTAKLHIEENFSITRMQEKTIALYNSLLN